MNNTKPKDRWPKEWARPFYGPEVIARDLIRAGKNLLKKVENDNTRIKRTRLLDKSG